MLKERPGEDESVILCPEQNLQDSNLDIGPLNNVCGMLPGPHWLPILPRFFLFFFLFSFAFFTLFFPLILRFSSSSSILLRNTKTSL